MADRPDFTMKNVVRDQAAVSAFQEGVSEGFANRDSLVVWKVSVSFEDQLLNAKVFDDLPSAVSFLLNNVSTVGQSATIECRWDRITGPPRTKTDSAPELPYPNDDEVVDAELVEG